MESKKKFMNKDRILALVWLAVSAYVWYEASTYPISLLDKVGPARYPHLLSVLIGIGALVLFVTSRTKEETKKKEEIKDYKSLLYVIINIGIYLALFNLIGFIASTIVFLLAMCLYFDTRDMKSRVRGALPFSIGFAVVVYLFFAKALGVQLPTLFL